MKNGTISVAMASCEGARHVREQLASIAAQTVLPDEVVVCDDCSTDGTAEVIRDFSRDAPFEVRLMVNESRLGITKNFEKAIGACRGDVIFLSDQDDVWYPGKVRETLACFGSSPRVGIVASDADIVDAALRPMGRRLWASLGFSPARQAQFRRGRNAGALLRGPVLTGATMAFRSEYRDLVLPIPEVWGHDGWIGLLIMSVAEGGIVDHPLIAYRQHSGNQVGFDLERKKKKKKQARRGKPFDALYDERVAQCVAWRERLREKEAWQAPDWVIRELTLRLLHLQARKGLPQNRLGRLPIAVRELWRGRYHRYAQGLKSFANDLLR